MKTYFRLGWQLLFTWVYVSGITVDELYPFGIGNGDAAALAVDDTLELVVPLDINISYFGYDASNVYIAINGFISIDATSSTYTPQTLPANAFTFRALVPFWVDIDNRYAGNVFYRQTTEPAVLARGSTDVSKYFPFIQGFKAEWALIVTWHKVIKYGDVPPAQENTFQVVIVADPVDTYTFFHYADINWSYMWDTHAVAGFDSGGTEALNIPGSKTSDMINIDETTNVGFPGVWTFAVGTPSVLYPDDECTDDPCLNEGICTDDNREEINTYVCTCQANFTGPNCGSGDECILDPCAAFGLDGCEDLDLDSSITRRCFCTEGDFGDECVGEPCLNGGTCTDNNLDSCDDYNCACPPGFSGRFCSRRVCGDGNLDAGEECDDGNNYNLDNCRNSCQDPVCGDDIKDSNEDCDDGNDDNSDECRNCKFPACGDGILDSDEECDDGNTNDSDGCQGNCRTLCSLNFNLIATAETLDGACGNVQGSCEQAGSYGLCRGARFSQLGRASVTEVVESLEACQTRCDEVQDLCIAFNYNEDYREPRASAQAVPAGSCQMFGSEVQTIIGRTPKMLAKKTPKLTEDLKFVFGVKDTQFSYN